MRVVFLGSGPFGLPVLELLRGGIRGAELVRVVSRPDRPQGRVRRPTPMPAAARALELGIPCDTPETANDPAYLESLLALEPDIFVVADYGELLKAALRAIPRIGAFNLHASLLPAYRGAAPVAHAVLCGERATGVTLFRIVGRLDAGPIVDRESTEVGALETAGELEARLSLLAARLLERNLERFREGSFPEEPQDGARATQAPKLTKDQGRIDWSLDSVRLTNLVRALNPWPVAWSFLVSPGRRPERTAFLRVRPGPPDRTLSETGPPGTIVVAGKEGFRVRCRGGAVEVLELQREGSRPVDGAAYLRGRLLGPEDRFGEPD